MTVYNFLKSPPKRQVQTNQNQQGSKELNLILANKTNVAPPNDPAMRERYQQLMARLRREGMEKQHQKELEEHDIEPDSTQD